MSTPHQLWHATILTRIGVLRDTIWIHGREWDELAKRAPAIYDEIRRLLDTYADPPPATKIRP